jgi:hypothetical protein
MSKILDIMSILFYIHIMNTQKAPKNVDSERIPMPVEQKIALVVLVSTLLVWGAYFIGALQIDFQPEVRPIELFFMFVAATVAQTVILVGTSIIIAIRNRAEIRDERDKLIELRAERVGGWVLSFGSMSLALALIFGGTFHFLPFPPWKLPPAYLIGNAIVLLFVVAESTKRIYQLKYYHRGV